MLLCEGWLWVTTTDVSAHSTGPSWLWRLDGSSLQVEARTRLPTVSGAFTAGSMAAAGVQLWVADGGQIDRVATIGGAIIGHVSIRGAREIGLATAEHGRNLLVSAGDGGGRAHIQRRNGVSGKLLATSAQFLGVTYPRLAPDGPRLWVGEATGMEGYVTQLWTRSLRPTGVRVPPALQEASNGIWARVRDGALWISQLGGGAARNYCGNPATGRLRVTMPPTEWRGELETASASRIYWLGTPFQTDLVSATIPAACR